MGRWSHVKLKIHKLETFENSYKFARPLRRVSWSTSEWLMTSARSRPLLQEPNIIAFVCSQTFISALTNCLHHELITLREWKPFFIFSRSPTTINSIEFNHMPLKSSHKWFTNLMASMREGAMCKYVGFYRLYSNFLPFEPISCFRDHLRAWDMETIEKRGAFWHVLASR